MGRSSAFVRTKIAAGLYENDLRTGHPHRSKAKKRRFLRNEIPQRGLESANYETNPSSKLFSFVDFCFL
jgi:hypothetical protein